MRLLGILLTALVVIAAAQATMAVLAILLVAGVVWCLFVCPKELFGLMGLAAVIGLFHAQPLASLGVVALLVIAKLLRRK
jgi:hypothetical protein